MLNNHEMNRPVKIRYTGTEKIRAVKSVRRITGTGLKEAKDAVESPFFEVTEIQRLAITADYMLSEDYGSHEVFIDDFKVVTDISHISFV